MRSLGAPPDLNGPALPSAPNLHSSPEARGPTEPKRGLSSSAELPQTRGHQGKGRLRDSRSWVLSENLAPRVFWPLFLTARSQQPAPAAAMVRGARGGSPVQVEGGDLRIMPLVVREVEEVGRRLLLPRLPGENRTRQKQFVGRNPPSGRVRSSCQLQGADCQAPRSPGSGRET